MGRPRKNAAEKPTTVKRGRPAGSVKAAKAEIAGNTLLDLVTEQRDIRKSMHQIENNLWKVVQQFNEALAAMSARLDSLRQNKAPQYSDGGHQTRIETENGPRISEMNPETSVLAETSDEPI